MACSPLELYVSSHHTPEADAVETFRSMIERRARREPLQYILGTTEFMSLEFEVTPGVFVPRPDTEVLVEQADAALRRLPLERPLVVADLCCGSGVIAVSLAARIPNLEAIAVDISKVAISVTVRNAARLGVGGRVRVLRDDAVAFLQEPPAIDAPEKFSAVLCNPPYIESGQLRSLPPEVRDHEPVEALDGGTDGLSMYRRMIPHLYDRLEPEGPVVFEIGDTQGEEVCRMLVANGFDNVEVTPDYAGRHRVVSATRRGD